MFSFTLIRMLIKPTIQEQTVRNVYRLRGKKPHEARSLEQLLNDYNYIDPEIAEKIDIGFPTENKTRAAALDRTAFISSLKNNKELEQASRNMKLNVSTADVKRVWETTEGPGHIRMAAEHYGVFQDLFGDAFFTPCVPLDVTFKDTDGRLTPVYRGNVIKPQEASAQPNVSFNSQPDDLWTLVLSNPDGHLTQKNKEYVHWFIGNIPGSALDQGEVVWDYIQPFPPLGVGFQRFVFVLYKQSARLDYSSLKTDLPCLELEKRTFETLEFYRSRQNTLTPAGLAFFQSDWDDSVRTLFHKVLNMEQPRFEYDFEQPYVAPPKWFARRKPFNMYLDKYRDPRDIAQEFLTKKLTNLDPFKRPEQPFPYPNVYRVNRRETPSWLITEQRRVKLGLGRINHQTHDLDQP